MMKDERGDNEYVKETFSEQIQEILTEYKIGNKPLARLLGWGETTIIRYMEGDIPTTEYLSRLKQIHCDPNYYYRLLLENRDKLTNVAFKKSRKAVLEKIMNSKIKLLAQYIINYCNRDITMWAVETILYYSQILSLTMYNKPIFEEKCQITYNILPYVELYEYMKLHGIYIMEIEENQISKEEKYIIQTVIKAFEWYNFKAASALLLKEREESEMEQYQDEEKKISHDNFRECYTKLFQSYQVLKPEDFIPYVWNRISRLMEEKK